ncbi:glycoside hydrolase family 28 protein [Backusella circina FSU 941]|nr:glycoside hydrolase family 28 protein [Backusella circina FSU 941]
MVRVATVSIISALLLTFTEAATKTCVVSKSSSDDATTIAKAFSDCKNGGTVSFPKGNTYYLKSMLKISGLKNVDVNFAGQIVLPGYDKKFKGGSAYLQIDGDNVNFYGGGTINGNGQAWYDAEDHTAPTVLRISADNSVFSNFKIINSPRAHIGITSATNVVLEHVTLNTKSSSSKPAKNTDALDVSSSKDIIFRHSQLTVGDDCTAINGGVTNITLTDINCNGGHGFSVGSLGKGGKTEYVKDVTITDSTCTNCQNGVRIKTWPGGKGAVQNVKFQNVQLTNTENPIIITTHYCDKNQMSYCTKNDAESLSISDVTIDHITGIKHT